MERVLELWVATHILVDTELTWKTYYNPTLPPNSLHSLSQPSDEGRLPIEQVSDPESHGLLCSQLRAAMEKRASQLSKFVINDLERRLLQRQKCGWFDTFIVAIILLNCVERTCWLFRSWDNENFAQRVSHPRSAIQELHLTTHSGPWTSVPPITSISLTALPTSSRCSCVCATFLPRLPSVPTMVFSRRSMVATSMWFAGLI